MWPKDNYQEHILGYLDGVRTEFERHIHSHFQQHDFNEFYTVLDMAFERLWQLIGACDEDWEDFRYILEASCDELLRAFYRAPRAGSWIFSVNSTIPKDLERVS